MKSVFSALLFFIVLNSVVSAQPTPASLRQAPWNSQWIDVPGDNGLSYGVFYFRKDINLTAKPSSFVVHVSADNRYKLYVNGTLVSLGPARCDTYYWNYETVDLAPYLAAGKNTVAALVWNEALFTPAAQISVRTGFILQGNSATEEILNTNNSWKCYRDPGHQPIPGFFFAASKGEIVDMNQAIKGDWTATNFDDNAWPAATKVMDGTLKGMSWGIDWALVPSSLPPREMTYQRILKLRTTTGVTAPSTFPAEKTPVTIPANTTATLLLDQTFETNAYITFNFSGGKDAGISLGYAETLYDKGSHGTRKKQPERHSGQRLCGTNRQPDLQRR